MGPTEWPRWERDTAESGGDAKAGCRHLDTLPGAAEHAIKEGVTALLTGRGNNTLKDKNLLPLLGRPALYYPAMAARRSPAVSRFFASSDGKGILAAAEACGYEPIQRPPELATPTALHRDAIMHALQVMRERGHTPSIVVVLLANCPTVLTEWIDDCIRLVVQDVAASAAVPVITDLDHHPYRAKRIGADGALQSFFDFGTKPVSSNRQDLEKSYFLCHNFWVLRTEGGAMKDDGDPPWSFMGRRVLPYVVDDSIDIHDLSDVEIAERWLRSHGVKGLGDADSRGAGYTLGVPRLAE
jgi:CMP-N,N'-diacetyllegionaminic acid synthase